MQFINDYCYIHDMNIPGDETLVAGFRGNEMARFNYYVDYDKHNNIDKSSVLKIEKALEKINKLKAFL